MEFQVKKEVEITLKLSQEELNTIVSAYGATNYSDRDRVASKNEFKILGRNESEILYSELKRIANGI